MVEQHNITDDLLHLKTIASALSMDPRNARRHSTRSMDGIKSSLSKFGQRKPVVVQKAGMVVRAGNGTVAAARSLGWTHVAAVLVDDDDLTATQFAIADNRSAELSEWDFEELGSTLRDLASADIDLDSLGWAEHEADNLIKADWSAPAADGSDGSEFKAARGLSLKFDEQQAEMLRASMGEDVTAEAVVRTVCQP